MTPAVAILLVLAAYNLALILIGLWASRRTRDTEDFFLGGRQLGALVAAISASASSSSAWTLLGVSGAAYVWGLPAFWLFPATLLGFLINWLWVAPRLMAVSRAQGALTLAEIIAGNPRHKLYPLIMTAASCIIVFSFIFYVASQFQAAGNAFATSFGLSMGASILLGAGIILVYTLLGGFWAVSVTDTLQGLLMAVTAIWLPLAALSAAGGWRGLWAGLAAPGSPGTGGLLAVPADLVGLGFVLGTLGIGLGYPGQPHVVNRFMALKSRQALRQARIIALVWATVIYAGMLLLGWCGRVLFGDLDQTEQVFFHVTHAVLPPGIAGIMIAAVLSAIMSTADSQLLVSASSVAHDLPRAWDAEERGLPTSRWVVLALCVLAALLALWVPDDIFTRVLFAWHAVGSSFGPILLVRLTGRAIQSRAILAALCAGFGLTLLLHFQGDWPGDVAERLLPFAVALGIAILGRKTPGDAVVISLPGSGRT
ncbi:MAG: sodium/proline symporter [Acidobacteriota bacterium]